MSFRAVNRPTVATPNSDKAAEPLTFVDGIIVTVVIGALVRDRVIILYRISLYW